MQILNISKPQFFYNVNQLLTIYSYLETQQTPQKISIMIYIDLHKKNFNFKFVLSIPSVYGQRAIMFLLFIK